MLAALRFVLVAAVLIAVAFPVSAAPLELTTDTRHASLEGRLEHLADASNALPFEVVQQSDFAPLPEFRSLGYDTAAHWFRFQVRPAAGAPSRWILSIGRPFLEEVDVWVSLPGDGFRHQALGKYQSHDSHALPISAFAMPLDLDGPTSIYLRVHSTNPIIVSADLWQPDAFAGDDRRSTLYVGLHFGILLIAVALYAILGGWLRDAIMATYAGYIASQALMIHGDVLGLFTSEAPWVDDVLTRVGWLGSSMFIVLMWDRLLELKQNHRLIHRLFQFTILLDLVLLPFALMPSKVTAAILVAVKLANVLNSANFFISMALVLWAWWRSRRVVLLLYFVAFLIPALGTLVNTAANQGGLVLNGLTANMAQIAPLVHVLVMSVGLALRLRQIQNDKAAAEQEVVIATQRTEEQRRFIAMLSHEFRNPLAAIDRAAQMILFKMPELPQAEAQRLATIRSRTATLFGFVDNFLMTEALDHGALALSREFCDIRPLVENAIRLQGDAAVGRVCFQMSPSSFSFYLDPTLIDVAVGNLLGNSLRYSPPETQVQASATLDDEGLRICVTDQGPGLSEEELAQLGTPYFRAASSLGKKGSGLGYHFTRRIVEAHGGTLTARSREGHGLEVEIFLPKTAV